MDDEPTPEQLRAALGMRLEESLQSLGDDADAVASNLHRAGVRGVKGSRCECPVAVWLGRQGFRWPSVDDSAAYVQEDGGDVRAYLPIPVYQFVDRFDRGRYPLLEAGWLEGVS